MHILKLVQFSSFFVVVVVFTYYSKQKEFLGGIQFRSRLGYIKFLEIFSFNFSQISTRYHLTYLTHDDLALNDDYLTAYRVQAFRSKIFLFFIDRFALESNWFLYQHILAKVCIVMARKDELNFEH
jgi:hypothetical protein